MSSEVLQRDHHHHHHHSHAHRDTGQRKAPGKLSRSQTLDRSSHKEKSSKHGEMKKCEKHAANGHKHDTSASETRSPASTRVKEPPARPQEPPSASQSSLRSSPHQPRPHRPPHPQPHSAGCRQQLASSRAHSSSGHAHSCHSAPPPGPVIISQHKERGDELVTEAEAKLSRSLFRSGDVQGGMESYQRAVAQYKLAGDWDSAAMTLTKMADIFRRQGDLMGAGRLHGEAGACFRKHSAHAAVQAYLKSAEMYIEMGKFGIPAKHHEAISMIYSKDIQPLDTTSVLHHLSLAAHYYYSDNRNAARNKCRLEMAKIHANSEQFEEALAIYEDLAYSSLESRLVKYSADEYFFRAALCHLAIDCLNCQIAIQKYIDYYPAFEVSSECKFLKNLCSELEQENEEGFDVIVKKNNIKLKLDPWYGAIIAKIRKEIPGELNSLR